MHCIKTMPKNIRKKNISAVSLLFEWLTWSVITISIVALIMLATGCFMGKPAIFIGLALATAVITLRLNQVKIDFSSLNTNWFIIIALIFVALIFRSAPYPYIHGDQDQGIYANMSSFYQREGQVFIEDELLKSIPPGELKETYLKNRAYFTNNIGYQPGIYFSKNKDYVFQFYHLHPLWMAMFADLFGEQARFYALTFFGLLGVVGVCLLVKVISGSFTAAIIAGFILAVNPLHVYFSKWPTTEVVTLAFSLLGFYYLYRTLEIAKKNNYVDYWLVSLSILSFSQLYFVRITGFIYIPLLIVLLWVGIWFCYSGNRQFSVILIVFSSSTIILYLVSLIYGLYYSEPYALSIYRSNFGKLFGPDWFYYIVLLIGLAIIFTIGWLFFAKKLVEKNISIENLLLKYGTIFVVFIFILGATIGIYKAYELGYNDSYASGGWYGHFWGLSGLRGEVLLRSSVLNWFLYVSPFLLIAAIWAAIKIKWTLVNLAHLFFITVVSVPNFIIQWVLPYQYYYSRYLLSEAVPYSIILGLVLLFQQKTQKLQYLKVLAIAFTILPFIYLSALQFGAEEGRQPYQVFDQISQNVNKSDLIILDNRGWDIHIPLIQTPLMFYHDLKIFPVNSQDEIDLLISRSALLTAGELWYLTPVSSHDERFTLFKKYVHYDKILERSGHIPKKIISDYRYQVLYLYKINEMHRCGPPYCLLLRASDRNMFTQVGQIDTPSVLSTNQTGFLLYGPYQPMKEGKYILVIEGNVDLNGGTAWIDIVAGKGTIELYKFELKYNTENKLIVEEIMLDSYLEDIEIRVWVDEFVDMQVNVIELAPIVD